MSFLKTLGKGLKSAVAVVVPVLIGTVVPEAVPATIGGAIIKHSKVLGSSNGKIPYLNVAVCSGFSYFKRVSETGDWAGSIVPALNDGVITAGSSTFLHQSIKLPLRDVVTGPIAQKVGPGEKFSL